MSPALKPPTTLLGQRLRDARRAAGLSQVQAARRTRISQGQWSEFETGASEPTLAVLRRMARALGVRPGDLL